MSPWQCGAGALQAQGGASARDLRWEYSRRAPGEPVRVRACVRARVCARACADERGCDQSGEQRLDHLNLSGRSRNF